MRTTPNNGHARPELLILVACIGIGLATAIPAFQKQGVKGALIALATTFGTVIGGIAAIILLIWLFHNIHREVANRQDLLIRSLARLFLFAFFCFCGIFMALPIAVVPELGKSEPASYLVAAVLAITFYLLHFKLGSDRFWPAFGKFCGTLVVSLFAGMFGMLSPGPWGIRLGAALPLLIFGVLLAYGKIVPPLEPPTNDS